VAALFAVAAATGSMLATLAMPRDTISVPARTSRQDIMALIDNAIKTAGRWRSRVAEPQVDLLPLVPVLGVDEHAVLLGLPGQVK
jgi:hypothetical protein